MDYRFYEDGTVKTPIVSTDHIAPFLGKCKELWCYYTGGCQGSRSNRLLNCSSERNRMLGIQMYYNGVKGFLHWGYNYWYDFMSKGLFDPKTYPEGCGLPGTSYMVYPSNDGTALQSIRQKVFYEGLNDIRALKLLESLYDRETAMSLIRKHYGEVDFDTEAVSADKLLSLREEVNKMIEKA